MDFTVPCDLPYDNEVPDVMVVTMPLVRLPEAEVEVVMFAPALGGSQKDPPSKLFIFANVIDHMACKVFLQDLPRILRKMPNRKAARNEVAQVLRQVARAMESTEELLRTQLNTPALFVSPPGMFYRGSAFQHIVHILIEVCTARSIESYMLVPTRQHCQSTRTWQQYLVCCKRLNAAATPN